MSSKTIYISRKELYELVWSIPVTKLSKEYELSDVGFAKLCKRHEIPLPGRGYWRQVETGLRLKRKPLPQTKGSQEIEICIRKKQDIYRGTEEDGEIGTLINFEKEDKNRINVPLRLVQPHPLIVDAKNALSSGGENKYGTLVPHYKKTCLGICVSPECLNRALRVMDALIKSLGKRGFNVSIKKNWREEDITYVTVMDEIIEFGLREPSDRKERKLSKAEKKLKEKDPWLYVAEKYEYHPSGKLTMSIKSCTGNYIRKNWSDGNKQRVEDCLNEFVTSLIKIAAAERKRRLEIERKEQERHEFLRKHEEEERLRREEEARVQTLYQEAADWHKCTQIRSYIQAVKESVFQGDSNLKDRIDFNIWIDWAERQADMIDPLKKIKTLKISNNIKGSTCN